MGNFKIVIEAVGGHGCDRKTKDGEERMFCGNGGFQVCPDDLAKQMVGKMRRAGMDVKSATLTHWPGEASEVVDDLVTNKRKGQFS